MPSQLQQRLLEMSGRVLVITLLVLSLVLITLYYREDDDGPLHGIQSTVSGLSAPFKFVGGAVGSGTEAATAALEDATASDNTLKGLRDQNEKLREEIIRLEEYRQEAIRLEGLLNIKDYYSINSVTARVINRSTSAWEKTITIDKGERDGVITGLPVMGSTGVIGQVISATSVTAEIRLLTDPQSGVAVLIQSNRQEGIVRGSLEGLLYLENVGVDVAVKVGDVVITSGLGGSYFRGLTIGTVMKVDENQGGSTRKIVVAPNAKTGPLEEVLVVLEMNSEGDILTPTEETEGQVTP